MSLPTNVPYQLVLRILREAIGSELAFAELFKTIAAGAAVRGDIAEQEWAADIANESTVIAVRSAIDLLETCSPLDVEA